MTRPDALQAYTLHEQVEDSYENLTEAFTWACPAHFNIATAVCDHWAEEEPEAPAVHAMTADGATRHWSFGRLQERTDSFARYLSRQGIGAGDRIVVTGVQRPETLTVFLGAWKCGATVVPVSSRYGRDGMQDRIRLSDASLMAAAGRHRSVLNASDTGDMVAVPRTEGPPTAMDTIYRDYAGRFDAVDTGPDNPAMIIFTSGTTGTPRGAILSHSVLLGQLPGFVFRTANMDLQEDDVSWGAGEWGWIIVMHAFCSLFYGVPIATYDWQRFDPSTALTLIDRFDVSICGFPTTTLRLLQSVDTEPYNLSSIRSIGIGGEPVSAAVTEWIARTFDDPAVNIGYGQTETCLIAGECRRLGMQSREAENPLGVPIPGYEVKIVKPDTLTPCDPGETGEIVVARNAVSSFQGYLGDDSKTSGKERDGHLVTGDLGYVDDDGYLWFVGRRDEVILSSGYRISPVEIEQYIEAYPAVEEAAVIGVPDAKRGEVPVAFIVIAPGTGEPEQQLCRRIQTDVKESLAYHLYPRSISIVDALPRTATGKVKRSDLRAAYGRDHDV